MSWDHRERNDSDDSDAEDDLISYATVIILDNSEKMFVNSDCEETCPFQNCLEALYNTLDQYMFDQWNNKLCLQLLDGREHGTFHVLSTDLMGIMQKIMEVKAKPADELRAVYCSPGFDNSVLYETFLDACDGLRKGTKGNVNRTIVILTNEADCSNCDIDNEDLDRVLESLQSSSIELIVVPLLSNFHWSKFYGKLVSKTMDDSSPDELTKEGYEDIDSLVKVLDRFVHPKRNVKNIIFYYGPGDAMESIHLQVRKTFKPKKLYHNAKVDPKSMRQCVKRDKLATGESVEDSVEYMDAGMWSDEFEPDEGSSHVKTRKIKDLLKDQQFTKTMRCYSTPGALRLLYLSKRRSSAHYVNKPAFIVEADLIQFDEQHVEMFDYFWEHCNNENTVLICSYSVNPRQKFHLVQLEPQSGNGSKYFMAQFLTFLNGIKTAATAELVRVREASGAELGAARELVRKLTISDTRRPFQVRSSAFESKAALIKGLLLSTKQQAWAPPPTAPNWPSRQQVSAKLGPTLQQDFNREYVAQVNKRKKK